MVGGDGHDRLIGGNGIDTLGGSEGQDEFVIQNARQGADHITDFDIAEDEILLDISGFGLDLPKGKLANARFTVGEGAGDNSDRVIYNSQTGALMFDSDGYRSQKAVVIAYLDAGLNLSSSNIRLF